MQSQGGFLLPGEREPEPLGLAGLVLPDHEVVAVGVGGEVAPRHLGHEDAAGPRLAQLLPQHGADTGLELGVRLASLGSVAPLVAEQRRLVQIGGDLVDGDALGQLRADERGVEHRSCPRAPRASGRGSRPGLASAVCWLLRGGRSRPPSAAAEVGVFLAGPLELAQAVHGAQAFEGVAAVEQTALVDLAQIPLDVGPGERGPAEQHGQAGQPTSVDLLEVLAHDQRRLHQQAAHAEGVRRSPPRPWPASRRSRP